jgi:hypothetical protein
MIALLEALMRKHNADLLVYPASFGFWAGLRTRAGINLAQARGITVHEALGELLADARKEAL